MKYTLAAMMLLIGFNGQAFASPEPLSSYINNPKMVGQTSRMTYLFWDVYDATLYAAQGQYDSAKPFALKLAYLRDLDGKAIAERSLEEMEKQGFKDKARGQKWLKEMKDIFPDVNEGTTLFGIQNAQGNTVFYRDTTKIGEVKDPEFSKWFFAIWLDEKTSEPDMRVEILGLTQ